MFDKISKKISSFTSRPFDYKILMYVGVFLFAVVYFWKYIVSFFKPANDASQQNAQVSKKNEEFKRIGSITANGNFINGAGGVTKYTITQARYDAESLSTLLNTYKGAKWYSVTLSFFGFGAISKIKAILNPNYPASYRRYVAQTYTDVYTNSRSLQVDVRAALTGFAGSSYWTNDLTKYFIF